VGLEAGAAAGDAVVRFLGDRFSDHSARLTTALQTANAHAWRSLEVALAGESWWDRVKSALGRREDQAFREQVQAFLRAAPLPGHDAGFRRRRADERRAARKRGALAGPLDAAALARRAGAFARFDDPTALLDAEWAAVGDVAGAVHELGFASLSQLLALRTGGDVPLLVV